ncbi:MAG: tryptophan synthase subunit alpha [Planctomycetota bacterium]|nr:MAG: tryptophan synthase subunit alpha [Planctomycetota bacterium]
MSRIEAAFEPGRAAFIPFVMAGDPDLATTGRVVEALASAGADVIELGLPFSDPIADGPTNQRAAARALAGGATPAGVLDLVRSLRDGGLATPIVLFSYLNPLLALGDYAQRLARARVDGLLCVDLPPEEAHEHERALASCGVDRIYLTAPSTAPERLQTLAGTGSGFVYHVSRYGVTGERDALPEGLERHVAAVRKAVGRPVAVGFGIAGPEQAAEVARFADGVVVGSAIVRRIERSGTEAPEAVAAFAGALAQAVHGAREPQA